MGGFGLASGNWLTLIACVVLPLPALVRRIHVHEAELAHVLGAGYGEYAADEAPDPRCPVTLHFVATSSAQPPASDLLETLHHEYDAAAGRALSGGPSAEPSDFAPPGGTFLVGYEHDRAVACGGLKTVGPGVAEVKRMYVVPQARRRGLGRALLSALEDQARALGFERVRLDCERHNWPFYRAAGYVEIDDYNDNPFADHWAEKHVQRYTSGA